MVMKIASLHDLLVERWRLFTTRKRIVKALPKVIRTVRTRTSARAWKSISRRPGPDRTLVCFEHLDLKPRAKTCDGMKGILEEGDEMIGETEEEAVDACIIGGCQKVEHYEIASYGTMCAWCQQLGLSEIGALLKQNLDEERAADEKLTQLAESMANAQAAHADEEEEEEKMAHSVKGNGRRR